MILGCHPLLGKSRPPQDFRPPIRGTLGHDTASWPNLKGTGACHLTYYGPESKADLAKLEADIRQGIEPTDFIKHEYVEDMAYHTWDIMRYQRVTTGILNNALRRALAQILNEILLPPSTALAIKCWMSSQRLSHGWLLDPESKRRVLSLLKEAGLDESAIEAKAYTLVADDLEKANRMLKSAREGRTGPFARLPSIARAWRRSCGGIPIACWPQTKFLSLPVGRRIEHGKRTADCGQPT